MALLYYWRGDNYCQDRKHGLAYHLNQANPLLHTIGLGESLWAFTRTPAGPYVLAAELVVRAKTCNPPGYRYGRYRVYGDLGSSRYFQTEGQPSVEPLIRRLSCRAAAPILGRSFQGSAAVRPLTADDDALLRAWAAGLPLDLRARLIPEGPLEQALLADTALLPALVTEAELGLERRRYLVHDAPVRNRQLVQQLHALYEGRCQVCRWDPQDLYGSGLCEGHHLQWLSRGGADTLANLVLLCPNHHAAIHGCDAPFDYGDYAFDFGARREPLVLDRHLRLAAGKG